MVKWHNDNSTPFTAITRIRHFFFGLAPRANSFSFTSVLVLISLCPAVGPWVFIMKFNIFQSIGSQLCKSDPENKSAFLVWIESIITAFGRHLFFFPCWFSIWHKTWKRMFRIPVLFRPVVELTDTFHFNSANPHNSKWLSWSVN